VRFVGHAASAVRVRLCKKDTGITLLDCRGIEEKEDRARKLERKAQVFLCVHRYFWRTAERGQRLVGWLVGWLVGTKTPTRKILL
jgi:hypothetical protein